jgi:uncharacterized protein (TIGR02594 family)
VRAVYEKAESYLGLKEYPGAKHNPKIIEFARLTGNAWVEDDETPWCASFVGAVLAQSGLTGSGRLNARSYLDWGEKADLDSAILGDVVVFWRGTRDGWQGHVGFYAGREGDDILVLGGNQGNAVSIASYSKSRLLGVRRARLPRTNPAQSKTVQASAVQVASGAGAGVSAVAALDGTAQLVALAFAGLIVLMALWIMRERLKKWVGGVR